MFENMTQSEAHDSMLNAVKEYYTRYMQVVYLMSMKF